MVVCSFVSATSNNELLAECVAFALQQLGVREWVISPGSRSTPLVIAAYRNPALRRHIILDERSAGFFALARADESGRPVALVCTSGTAPAHYLPAIIEAHERGVPLIALTADRPFYLRDCGAGQTIDQEHLFGKFVRAYAEVSMRTGVTANEVPAILLKNTYQTLSRSLLPHPGPVQLNCPFEEPLVPAKPSTNAAVFAGLQVPAIQQPQVPAANEVEHLLLSMRQYVRGWIVAGAAFPTGHDNWVNNVRKIAQHLGWPIITDVLNPLRHHPQAGSLITHYVSFFKSSQPLPDDLLPEAILQIGFQPTSKSLRQFLAQHKAARFRIDPSPREKDPARHPSLHLKADLQSNHWLPDKLPIASAADWAEKCSGYFAKFAPSTEKTRDVRAKLTEADIYTESQTAIPKGCHLVLGNSMPVRYAEQHWGCCPADGVARKVFCNRGANGIDGVVSYFCGIASGSESAVGIIGDLTFLHDLTGLRLAKEVIKPCLLIVVDNGGGQIFSHLPARDLDCFQEAFLTPQNADLVKLSCAHGIPCRRVSTLEEFRQSVSNFPQQGLEVLIAEVIPS